MTWQEKALAAFRRRQHQPPAKPTTCRHAGGTADCDTTCLVVFGEMFTGIYPR